MPAELATEIQSLMNQATTDGRERGMQVAVYHDGKLILDAAAGFTSEAQTEKVTPETLFPVTKGVVTTMIHRLIQQGVFDLDQTIASVWPAFGANGKQDITLRHVLAQTAGLACLPAGTTAEEMADWPRMCRLMEMLTPRHAPGAKLEYHAITYGWLLGGAMERATGRSFGELLASELCEPLGLQSLYVGIPEKVPHPIAVLESRLQEVPPDPALPAAVPASLFPLTELMNRSAAQHACIPATTGIMRARDIARHYAALLPGGVDGIELLTEVQRNAALDFREGMQPGDWVSGYTRRDGLKSGPTRFFGNRGHGRSVGRAHLDKRLAYAIVHNAFSEESVWEQIETLILKYAS